MLYISTYDCNAMFKRFWFCFLSSMEINGRLMDLNAKDGKMKVNYSERLVTLLREVRQLGALGFSIPAKIQNVAATAQKFYRQGVILKQVLFCSHLWGCLFCGSWSATTQKFYKKVIFWNKYILEVNCLFTCFVVASVTIVVPCFQVKRGIIFILLYCCYSQAVTVMVC